MPFLRVGEEQKIRLGIINKLPIFFIPGILGSGDELRFLAWRLYTQSNEEREIFIFDDERLLDASAPSELNLNEQVDSIANEIKSMMPKPSNFTRCNTPSPFPFFIIGYSYGCTLATLVAQQLEAQGEKPYVYLIDGVSPTGFQRYIDDQNNIISFTQDLILMANSATNLTGIKPCDLIDIKKLTSNITLHPVDFMDEMEKSIVLFNVNEMMSEHSNDIVNIEQISKLSVNEIIKKLTDSNTKRRI